MVPTDQLGGDLMPEMSSPVIGKLSNNAGLNDSATLPGLDDDDDKVFAPCDNTCMIKYWLLEGYLIILLIGTVAVNSMSIYKLYKQTKQSVGSAGHDSNLACIVGLNLSAINLAVGVLVITPMVFQLHFSQVLFGTVGCRAFAMLFNIYLVGTPLFMVLNATERFIAIVYPLRLTELITKKRLRVASVTIWTILTLFGFGFMLGSEVQANEATQTYFCIVKLVGLNTVQSGFPICFLFVIAPIVVLVVLYGLTCWTLLKSVRQFRRNNPTTNYNRQSQSEVATAAGVGKDGNQSEPQGTNNNNNNNKSSNRYSPVHTTTMNGVHSNREQLQLNGVVKGVYNSSSSSSPYSPGCTSTTTSKSFNFSDNTSRNTNTPGTPTPNVKNEAVARRYRATCLLLSTVVSHSLLCIPFIVNQFMSAFKEGVYPETSTEENINLFSTPILVTSSALIPLIYLCITNCNSNKSVRRGNAPNNQAQRASHRVPSASLRAPSQLPGNSNGRSPDINALVATASATGASTTLSCV